MNKYILSTILAAATATQAFSATPTSASADVTAIEPYVFPSNRTNSPSNFTYMADGESYCMLSDDYRAIDVYDIRSGKKTSTLLDLSHTRETTISDIDGFKLSDDGKKILLWRNSQKIYRRSYDATYYVYEIRTRLLKPLSDTHDKVRTATFSPNGRMVAFVADNNIYIKKLDYNTEVAVTTDGVDGKVINGVPDWVYEEEFDTNNSLAWSPDDNVLCYIRYDESQVPMYTLPQYNGTCNPKSEYALYPGSFSYKYPVAGQPNSRVSVHSYQVDERKIKEITLPDANIEYVPRIRFAPNGSLMVATLDRNQSHLTLYAVNPLSTVVRSIYTEESEAWIAPETYQNISYNADGMVIMSARDGMHMQLYKYSYSGALLSKMTSADYDVTEYYGADAAGNHYFQAATPTPIDRSIMKRDAKGAISRIIVPGTATDNRGTASAEMSPGCRYAVYDYSDKDTAPIYTMCTAAGKAIRTLIDNKAYQASYADMSVTKEWIEVPSDGNMLNGYVVRPTNLEAGRKYPVVMYQYSGPGSQVVLNRWEMDWMFYFAQKGIITVCVDGRGTAARGSKFMHSVYRNLGYYETIDQVNAARYIAAKPWADPARIAIYGWSYGGFEALMAASAKDAPYAACIAIAPVTDWRYYDTIYGERFMQTPQQNDAGYNTSSPVKHAADLKCPLLIMCGTADDNVHPANTYEYVSQLQSRGILCDMLIFPNMNHSINGCNSRAVVFANMLRYLQRQFK